MSERYLLLTVFLLFSLDCWTARGLKHVLAISVCGRGPTAVEKRKMLPFFFLKMIRDEELNCLLSAVSALYYNT